MSTRKQTKRGTAPAPLELHEFCLMVPQHSREDYARLVADLKKTGKLIEAITTFEGKVLDGRGRRKACREAGITPHYTPFQGTRKEAFDFVLSKNLARRHLTIAQRKALAAVMYKEDPTVSTNKVAKTVGLSNKTAEKERPKEAFGKSKRRDTKRNLREADPLPRATQVALAGPKIERRQSRRRSLLTRRQNSSARASRWRRPATCRC